MAGPWPWPVATRRAGRAPGPIRRPAPRLRRTRRHRGGGRSGSRCRRGRRARPGPRSGPRRTELRAGRRQHRHGHRARRHPRDGTTTARRRYQGPRGSGPGPDPDPTAAAGSGAGATTTTCSVSGSGNGSDTGRVSGHRRGLTPRAPPRVRQQPRPVQVHRLRRRGPAGPREAVHHRELRRHAPPRCSTGAASTCSCAACAPACRNSARRRSFSSRISRANRCASPSPTFSPPPPPTRTPTASPSHDCVPCRGCSPR